MAKVKKGSKTSIVVKDKNGVYVPIDDIFLKEFDIEIDTTSFNDVMKNIMSSASVNISGFFTSPKSPPPDPQPSPAAPTPETSLSAYDILGIPSNASPDDIVAAYRRMVKRYHPDVAGEAGREMFEDVQRAYKLLSDPKKRKAYDVIRKMESDDKNGSRNYPWTNPIGTVTGGPYTSGSSTVYNVKLNYNPLSYTPSTSASAGPAQYTAKYYPTHTECMNNLRVVMNSMSTVRSHTDIYDIQLDAQRDRVRVIEIVNNFNQNNYPIGKVYSVLGNSIGIIVGVTVHRHNYTHGSGYSQIEIDIAIP